MERIEIDLAKFRFDELIDQWHRLCWNDPDMGFEDYLVNLIDRGYNNVNGILKKDYDKPNLFIPLKF